MAKKVIKVTIKPDGTNVVEVEGVPGKKCTELTEGLEVFLGKAGQKEFTADYYKPDPAGPETWITRN